MKLRNTVENIIIALVVFIVGASTGGAIGYKSAVNAGEKVMMNQKSLIEDAIHKESTSITNAVTTQIDKIKSKKSEPINIVIDPSTQSIITQSDTNQIITVEEEKGFFRRLFQKKNRNE